MNILLKILISFTLFFSYLHAIDTDNDSIINIIDLDDDNDGILDKAEMYCVNDFNPLEDTGTDYIVDRNSKAMLSLVGLTLSYDGFQDDLDGRWGEFKINYSTLAGTTSGAVSLSNVGSKIRVNFSKPLYNLDLYFGSLDRSEIVDARFYDVDGNIIELSTNRTFNTAGQVIATQAGQSARFTGVESPNANVYANYSRIFIPNAVSYFEADLVSSSDANADISISVMNACSSRDYDNDNIPNHLDLDSDNDGIPDNVEAQSTLGYLKPNNVFDANGVDTAYTAGLSLIDTDNDEIADYADLDSDGDGIFDIYESGLGNNDSDNDGRTNNAVGNNGLDNSLSHESADNYADVNGKSHNGTVFNLNDSDNDGNLNFRDLSDKCSASISGNSDVDGDNVSDICDVDIDNDGILNDDEGICGKTITANKIVFILDTSGSIQADEYSDMTNSINELSTKLLEKDPNAQIAIVQYGSSDWDATTAGAVISRAFSNAHPSWTTAQRDTTLGAKDHLPASLVHMRDYWKNSGTLDLTQNTNNTIIIFTDAHKHLGIGSVLYNTENYGKKITLKCQ